MRLIATLTFVLAAFSTASNANTIRIMSGEHTTFSRLVLYFDVPVNWRFGRSESGYIFVHDGPALTFDTQDVFRYIPRNRVASIEQDSAAKRMEVFVSCTCTADAFELRDGVIVLDFKDGAPDAYSRFETPIDPPDSGAEAPERQALATPTTPGASPMPLAPMTPTPDFTTALTRNEVELMQTALLEHLSKAMSQGLADTQTTPRNDTTALVQRPSSTREIAELMNDSVVEYQAIEDPLRGVSIRTQVELDASRQTEPTQTVAANCPTPSDLDISSWGDPDRMMEGLAQHRSNLVSPALLPSSDGALELARYYVWLGFGTEARAVMVLHKPDSQSRTSATTAIHVLSGVLDGLTTPDAEAWKNCQGATNMWSFLASVSELTPLPSAKATIIRAFEGLPNHLKQHIGPMLFDRFIVAGDKDAAETIRRSTSRSMEMRSPQIELLDAQTLLDSGDTSGALQEFARLAKGSDTLALQALVAFAETSLKAGTKLPQWAIESLRAQAAVYKGTPDSARIEDLLLDHLIADDRVGEVAIYLKDEPFDQTEEDQTRLLALLEAALPKADDTVFSELAVRNRDLVRRYQPAESLRAYISNRFRDLGFESTAASFEVAEAPGDDGANPRDIHGVETDPHTEAPLPNWGDSTPRPDAADNGVLTKLSTEPALPRMNDTAVSIPESQDLLAAARTRRQLVNELLSTVPTVD